MVAPLTNIANNEEYTQEYNDLVLYTRQNNICLFAFDDSAILKLEANAMGSFYNSKCNPKIISLLS